MMVKPYVRSVSSDTGKVDTKHGEKKGFIEMKKKIIISLILAMCCIMASIPASATGTCSPGCSDWSYVCMDYDSTRELTHRYTASNGLTQTCTYLVIRYEHEAYCGVCHYPKAGDQTHIHAEAGHDVGCGRSDYSCCALTCNGNDH